MRKYALFLLVLLSCAIANAQMSDSQVMKFIAKETKAGTSQSQIVTKLMQKGVKIDQIRRLRQKYNKQLASKNMSSVADGAVEEVENRMRSGSTTGQNAQQLTVGKEGSGQEDFKEDADIQYAEIRQNINEHTEGVVGEEEIKVFGRDIFNNKLLSFEPNMNIATPQNYVLGPGDVVIVDIYGATQRSQQLTISPDGNITVPGYGPIHVAGLSVAAAQSKIRSSLGSRYSSSSLNLTLGQTRTMMINVMGEVKVPGTYTLSAFATVFHALYMAGGIDNLGTLRNIKVYRNGKLVTVVDVYEYILNGRLAGNIRLQENDVIVVGPYDCLVGIQGNVKRPMFYEMRPTETVSQIINYAGGFTGDAYKKSVRLVRKSGDKFSVHNVEEFDMSAFKLTDGDAITVEGMLNRYDNMVEVKGAVFRPGKFELGKNVNSVRTLIERADGLTEDAFVNRAVLYRMKDDRTLEALSIDLPSIMADTSADIPLRNEDVLFIGTQAERIAERTVEIQGEVLSPGQYQYAENETLEDLIIRAGGLTDAASTVKVDVSRRIRDPKSTMPGKDISQNFSFSLKDGFIVDDKQGFTLEPYDVVQVRRSPGYMTPRSVRVEGEVAFEGQYTLSKKNQRISDLIAAAGGVTNEAYVRGARLVRLINDEEMERLKTAVQIVRQSADGKDSVNLDQIAATRHYTVGIDLEKALANPGSDYDVVVRDSDLIVVPEYNGTVKISGNVHAPNTVAYMGGKNWKYYVNQAGGFGHRSKKSETFIVYQNGTMSLASKGKVEPGCEILVPQKGKKDTSKVMQWVSIGTSFASLATMVASIANIIRK
ncbi:MAG: SLBB domain-containing protein [Bacteroidaceae bacterium]|nr:SLBB domain-containing protein [Bacteroidaceae bacterium]